MWILWVLKEVLEINIGLKYLSKIFKFNEQINYTIVISQRSPSFKKREQIEYSFSILLGNHLD